MGFFGKFFGFFSPRIHGEIASLAVGKGKEKINAAAVKTAAREVLDQWLWSCMVLGDRVFPSLKDKKIAGKIHASGVLVLAISLTLPGFLAIRMIRRITAMTRKPDSTVQQIVKENKEANEKVLAEMKRRREDQNQQPKPQSGTNQEVNR